jgi:3-oxoacyl-[acyl-carrier protein] reductase
MQINKDVPNDRLGPKKDSNLLIIGGYGGIGFELTQWAGHAGVNAFVVDLLSSAERRSERNNPTFFECDIRDEQSVVSCFNKIRTSGLRFDAVAVCSGYTRGHDHIKETLLDTLDDVIAGNLRGPITVLREVYPLLCDNAKVVLLSTAIGQIGAPGYVAYGAAKNGLNSVIRTAAAEWAPRVIVNGVAPGAVDTAFIRGGYSEGAADTGPASRFSLDDYAKRTPLGRMATPKDVLGPILFLLSDAANYITGQVIHVNGGAFMRD